MRKRRKTDTSKKLLIFSDILTVAVAIITVLSIFILKDSTPLSYLIPAAFGLSGVSHGFYYWKAKAENLHKYGRDREITEDMDNDNNTLC